MIKFRDFSPPVKELGLLGRPRLAPFERAVESANGWIEAFHIDVVNIETVLLPNAWNDTATAEAELEETAEETRWYQIVRVWYRDEPREPDTDDDEIRVFGDASEASS